MMKNGVYLNVIAFLVACGEQTLFSRRLLSAGYILGCRVIRDFDLCKLDDF